MDAQSPLYRAVWRWHFYAGLLVMPFLILLAVTGALYLFKPEIERLVYPDLIIVGEKSAHVAPSVLKASFEHALDGQVLQMTLPAQGDQSVKALVRIASGEVRTAYADPYDGRFLGDTPYGGVMEVVRKLHSLQLFGFWASSLVEAAAGWAIIMVFTGVFLWWPRGAKGGVVTIRGAPRQRVFWRDAHAVIGIFAGLFIVFLAVTGMPWSMFWGEQLQGWVASQELGRPPPPAEVTPGFLLGAPRPPKEEQHGHGQGTPREELPWALQQGAAPKSASGEGAPLGIDGAVARFEAVGVPRPFAIQPPEGPHGAWAATYAPDKAEGVRLVYLDQRSGAVLGDVGFKDFGAAAQVIEWGIAVHQGQQFGPVNRYIMLAACLAIVLLAVSALTMWWMRRPKGRLGAPPPPDNNRAAYAVLGAIAVIGVIYPLTGVSIAGALAVDWFVGQVRRPSG